MALDSFKHHWEPAENPAAAKTLLLLHGTGGNERDLIPLGQSIAPDANLLSPRGRVDEHGQLRFFRRFAEGVFDQENMEAETHALAAFVQAAQSKYGFDGERVIAVGFSNGANIGASLMLRHPEVLKGGFLMRAMVPFEPDNPPPLMGISVLISSGESDAMVTRSEAERLATILAQGGADVEHIWLPGGHQLTRQELAHAKEWLTTHF